MRYSHYRFNLLTSYSPEINWVIPIAITGGQVDFTLFAIWANNLTNPEGQYVEQVWKDIQYYDEQLTNKTTISIGDFNSNTIWKKGCRGRAQKQPVILLKKMIKLSHIS
ncbi:MAG: hypothetical protein ABIY90_13435 [Puia sp.]